MYDSASVAMSLDSFREYFVTKEQYEDEGIRAISKSAVIWSIYFSDRINRFNDVRIIYVNWVIVSILVIILTLFNLESQVADYYRFLNIFAILIQ